jgi:hypothetical protein
MRVALEKVLNVVSLALKAPPLMNEINAMTLQNRPTNDRHLQRVTVFVSDIGQRFVRGVGQRLCQF